MVDRHFPTLFERYYFSQTWMPQVVKVMGSTPIRICFLSRLPPMHGCRTMKDARKRGEWMIGDMRFRCCMVGRCGAGRRGSSSGRLSPGRSSLPVAYYHRWGGGLADSQSRLCNETAGPSQTPALVVRGRGRERGTVVAQKRVDFACLASGCTTDN